MFKSVLSDIAGPVSSSLTPCRQQAAAATTLGQSRRKPQMPPLDRHLSAVEALLNATNASLCQTEDGRTQLPYCEMLQCEVERAPNTEYIGVGLQVLSVSISASCLLIMKLSTDYEQGLPLIPCRRGACHRNGWKWRFVAGWAANTASEAFISTLAFYFAPLSVLAPITGVGILVSALLAGTGYVPCFGFPPGFKEHISDSTFTLTHALTPNPNPAPTRTRTRTLPRSTSARPSGWASPCCSWPWSSRHGSGRAASSPRATKAGRRSGRGPRSSGCSH